MKLPFNKTTTLRLAVLMGLSTLGHCLRVSGVTVPPVVVAGSTVSLTCSYEQRKDRPDPIYSVKWYRGVEQFYEYVPSRDKSEKAFPLPNLNVDESKSHRTTVVLTGVTKIASGTYRCEVVGDKPHFETDEYAENMTVIETPQWGPEIAQAIKGSGDNRVRPGDLLTAQCIVGVSDPPVSFVWSVNGGPPPKNAMVNPLPEIDTSRPHQSSELEMTVTEASFQKDVITVSCQVTLSTIYDKTTGITLVHADHPQPAEFGWLSSGFCAWSTLVVLQAIAAGALSVLLVC